ncbi:MAG: ArsR/SmtB family transcription factor [Ferrovibrio sp.]|uniref:ArsR/SmtB family transcription factor n=1 Tax=Ferrovibrio sp. TaxID=1917215 RepID=UPI00391D3359
MFNIEPIADHRADLLADMFRLLGDPSRLKLVLILCQGPSAATAAAARAGLSPQLASHHLRLLKAARLVRAMRRGREIHYDIADDHVRHMLADMVAHVSEPHHDEKG